MSRHALLFDLDGTLIDSIGLLLESMRFAFEGRERAPTTEEWVRTQLAEWCDGEAEVEALVVRYRDYQTIHLPRLTTAYPGVLDMMQWARAQGHATALVTSKGRGMTGRSLEHVGLAGAFDAIVTFEETTRHKPLPDPVLLALERLALPASGALFVGDSPHDMHSGRAAGVRTAAAEWGPFSRAELAVAAPDYWMNSITQLPAIVASLTSGRTI